jgi:hypothetical protein
MTAQSSKRRPRITANGISADTWHASKCQYTRCQADAALPYLVPGLGGQLRGDGAHQHGGGKRRQQQRVAKHVAQVKVACQDAHAVLTHVGVEQAGLDAADGGAGQELAQRQRGQACTCTRARTRDGVAAQAAINRACNRQGLGMEAAPAAAWSMALRRPAQVR